MSSPLSLYVKLSRLVFSVEPIEDWDDYDEFEEDLLQLYSSICCSCCNKLLVTPVIPKKNHFSCQHRVCLDCIGRKRTSFADCEMCNDYTLFEKSSSTKLVLDCFQELCELIHSSWIYEYIKKHRSASVAKQKETSLIEAIESGMNYGKVSIVIDDTSSDENSSSSDSVIETTPITSPVFTKSLVPEIPPSPVKTCTNLVQSSPEPKPVISIEPPVIATTTIISTQPRPLVQFPVQSQVSSTSKLLSQTNHHHLQQSQSTSYIKYSQTTPVRLASPAKSIMTPMKLQAMPSTPQIYSVMYTGSGNKITLKRKPPDELSSAPVSLTTTTTTTMIPIVTAIPSMSSCAAPMISVPISNSTNITNASQMTATILQKTDTNNLVKQQQQSPNVISNSVAVATNQLVNQSNEKRRGCRCGNATAAPGKLTCCGQRCPCYVESKACIDCKCRGCRNPHFIDGHKKMRHPVPDSKTQQQQQQNFLASMQHQLAIKEKISVTVGAGSSAVIPSSTDLNITGIDKSTFANCIIGNGFQLKATTQPRIIMKDAIRTMNPVIFNQPTQTLHHQSASVATSMATSSNIQILGLYSQVPMMGDKKIIIKNDQTASSVLSFTDTSKQHFETTNTAAFNTTNNLNKNLL